MQFVALTGKPREELQTLLRDEQRRLEQLRVAVAEGTHKNVRQLRAARREIAQLQTALGQSLAATAVPAKPSAAVAT